jgi:alpha-L-rhamnosidase
MFVLGAAVGCHSQVGGGGPASSTPTGNGGSGGDGSAATPGAGGVGNGTASTGGSGGRTGDGSGAAAGSSGGATSPPVPSGSGGGAVAASGGQPGPTGDASPLTATRLRAELRENPIGVQTATPRLSWELTSSDPTARGESQAAYELLVASSPDKLAADVGDLWASGVVVSPDSSTIYGGQSLAALTPATWKVRVRDGAGRLSGWSDPAEWTVGLLAASDWGGAAWITAGSGATATSTATALPLFRREVQVTKSVTRARVAICGLGQFEIRVNGVNVSDAVMEPSWTNFTKTCHYSLYDVTSALAPGTNAIGVLLGNGMYNVPASARYAKFTGSFGPPKLIARLQIDYADGTSAALVSDAAWKTAPGPITFSNIYGGEDFDARLEPTGWDQPGFADAAWTPATVVAGAGPALVARSAPPIRVAQELATAKITQPQPGVFVYDLGQNFSGWPEITVSGAAGMAVRLTPAELLATSGMVTQANVGSPVWFAYTPRGTGPETWHPRFSFTGFRYVQVEGAVPAAQAASFPGRPQVVSLTGKFLHASAESVGTFTSSDQDLNKIHALILAALRSNLQSVLTDCPQREKLGWLETSHLLASSLAFDHDVAAFYEKVLRDMSDAQTSAGLVPDIAPEVTVFAGSFRDSPEWGSAFVINPWFVYQTYGDRQPLDEHYSDMKRYVSYLSGKATQSIISYGLGDWYDVGPAAPGASQLTSAGLTATAIWLQDLEVLRQSATLLGKPAEATQFQATEAAVTAAFNARFLNAAAGTYDKNSQTADAMPLALGLVPAAQRSAVVASLVAAVSTAGNRVSAGDIGFVYLLRALSDAGRGDVIYRLLKQSSGPGYLYQIAHGATALTEAWDANPSSSQNHAMLGHAEEWLYRGLGGINPDPAGPGFKKFIINPQPQTGLTSVDVQYHSIRGLIASSWRQGTATAAVTAPAATGASAGGAGLTLNVSVPVNTTATIYVPTASPQAVTEGGRPVTAGASGIVSVDATAPGAAVLVVGSGNYTFTAP